MRENSAPSARPTVVGCRLRGPQPFTPTTKPPLHRNLLGDSRQGGCASLYVLCALTRPSLAVTPFPAMPSEESLLDCSPPKRCSLGSTTDFLLSARAGVCVAVWVLAFMVTTSAPLSRPHQERPPHPNSSWEFHGRGHVRWQFGRGWVSSAHDRRAGPHPISPISSSLTYPSCMISRAALEGRER